MAELPPERDVKEFRFQQLCKFRVTDSSISSSERVQLLANSSKYALTFVAVPEGLKVYDTQELLKLDLAHSTERSKPTIGDVPVRSLINLTDPISHIAISCDELTITVVCSSNNNVILYLYDIRGFTEQNAKPNPFKTVRLNTSVGSSLLDIKWNPELPNIVITCTSDGCVELLEVNDNIQVSTLPASTEAACFSWSPKGKQFVVGKKDGTLCQYDRSLVLKKSWECPPCLEGGPYQVVDVAWLSTYMFLVAYLPQTAEPSDQPQVVLITSSKEGKTTYSNYEDVCFGSGEVRKARYYMNLILKWDMAVIASANATETTIIAKNLTDKVTWEHWIMEDSGRAELPLTESKCDSFPVGFTISFSSTSPDPNSVSASPLLMLLSTDGLLVLFYMVYSHPDAVIVTAPPQQLMSDGQRKGKESTPPVAATNPLPGGSFQFVHKPPTTSAFGGFTTPVKTDTKPTSLFGTPATGVAATCLFGTPPTGGAAKPLFGTPATGGATTSLFGTPPTGGAAKPLFGTPATEGASRSLFGTPPTGGAAKPLFGTPATGDAAKSLFSFTPSSTASPAAGVFGANPSPTILSVPNTATLGQTSSKPFSFTSAANTTGTTQQTSLAANTASTFSFGNSSTVKTSLPSASAPTKTALFTGSPAVSTPKLGETGTAGQYSFSTAGGSGISKPTASVSGFTGTPLGQPKTSIPTASVGGFTATPAQPKTSTPTTSVGGFAASLGQPRTSTVLPQTTVAAVVTDSTPTNVDSLIHETSEMTFTDSILEEMAHFEKELRELKSRTNVNQYEIGTKTEMQKMKQTTDDFCKFCKDIRAITKEQSREVCDQKALCLDSFAMAEDCNVRKDRNNDPKYHKLLRSRALDPASADSLKKLQQQYQAIEQGVRDVDLILDTQWDSYQNKRNKSGRIQLPTNDTIYRAIKSNHNLISNQQHKLDEIQEKLKHLQLYKSPLQHNLTDSINMLATGDTSNKTIEKPSMKSSPVSTVSPEKQCKLRNMLMNRTVPKIKSTAPANLSMSRIVVSPSLNESSLNISVEDKKSPAADKSLNRLYSAPQPQTKFVPNVPMSTITGQAFYKRPHPSLDPVAAQDLSGNIGSSLQSRINTSTGYRGSLTSGTSIKPVSPSAGKNTIAQLSPAELASYVTSARQLGLQRQYEDITPPSSSRTPDDEDEDDEDYDDEDYDDEDEVGFGSEYDYISENGLDMNSTPVAVSADGTLLGKVKSSEKSTAFGFNKTAFNAGNKPLFGVGTDMSPAPKGSFSFGAAFSFGGATVPDKPSSGYSFGSGNTSSFSFLGNAAGSNLFSQAAAKDAAVSLSAFGVNTTKALSPPRAKDEFDSKNHPNLMTLLSKDEGKQKNATAFDKDAEIPGEISLSSIQNKNVTESKQPGGFFGITSTSSSPANPTGLFTSKTGAAATQITGLFGTNTATSSLAGGTTGLFGARASSATTSVLGSNVVSSTTDSPTNIVATGVLSPPSPTTRETPTESESAETATGAALNATEIKVPNTVQTSTPISSSDNSKSASNPSPSNLASNLFGAVPSATSSIGAATSSTGTFTSNSSTPSFGGLATPTSTSAAVFGVPASTTSTLFGQMTAPSTAFGTTTTSSSVFGTTSAPTSAPTSSAFGTSLGGANTSPSLFGSSGFGSTTTQSSVFGTTTTVPNSGFGATTLNSGFGTATAPSSGIATATQSSGFGATSTQSSIFGSTPSFGSTSNTSSVFGNKGPQSTSIFGSGSPGFGSNSTGALGQTSTSFGQTSSAFGQSSTTTFGSSSVAPAFGQTATTAPVFGSSGTTTGTAGGGGGGLFSGLGGQPSAEKAGTNVFGANQTFGGNPQASSLFGSTSTTNNVFGASSPTTSGAGFGSNTGSFSLPAAGVASTGFGATSPTPKTGGFGGTPAFGGSAAFGGSPAFGSSAVFGGSPTVPGTTSTFGSATFGATSPLAGSGSAASFTGFGSASSPTFGNLATKTDIPSFGNIGQSSGAGFGQASATGFGQASGAGFGQASGAGFGNQSSFGGSPSFGGQPAFGNNNQGSFGNTSSFSSYR